MFGNQFNKLNNNKSVNRTEKFLVIHIALANRIKEIFFLSDLFSLQVFVKNVLYISCGKVNLCRGGLNMLGYVIDEHNGPWVIHCLNNKTVHIPCLKYSNAKEIKSYKEIHAYDLPVRFNSGWSVTHYSLVCIRITENAMQNLCLQTNRLLLKDSKVCEQLNS